MSLRAIKQLFRRRPRFGDYLPWKDLVDPEGGYLTTTDDGVMCTFAVDPYDLASMDEAESGAISLIINNAFKRQTNRSAHWEHGKRRSVTGYPKSKWPEPVSELLDDEHRAALTKPGARLETQVYLTAYHKQDSERSRKIDRVLYRQPAGRVQYALDELLDTFTADMEELSTLLGPACHSIERLDGAALLTYLHGFISIYDQPVAVPDPPFDISYALVDCGIWLGTRPILGRPLPTGEPSEDVEHCRLLTMTGDLPPKSRVMMWPQLYTLPFAFDWMTRIVPMGRTEAADMAQKKQLNWHATKKSGKVMIYERLGSKDTGSELEDSHSRQHVKDADAARAAMLSDESGLVHQTTTFLVRDRDPDVADAHIRELGTLLRGAGCVASDEGLNAIEAFFGMNPGQMHTGWRKRPNDRELTLKTMNFAHMGCWHKPWAGDQTIPHLKGAALTQAITDECNPFGLSPWVGDVAISKEIGPKGSGKSAGINWKGVQFGRFEGSELFTWDKDRSSRCMTLCLGGAYHDLSRDDLGIQIMSRLDDEHAFQGILQWLKNRVYAYPSMIADPDIDTFLFGVLEEMRKTSELPRTLSEYDVVMSKHGTKIGALANAQGNPRTMSLSLMFPKIRAALQPYVDGAFKRLVNSPVERFHLGRMHTFEDGGLSKHPEAYAALFEVVFDRLKERRHGQPIRNHFDEAWHVYRNPTLVKQLSDDIPSWRKDNVSAAFATQSISQTEGSALTALLIENAECDFYYPNAMATAPRIIPMYEGLNLTRTDCEIIARATPKQDMYVVKLPEGKRATGGRRLISLRLSPIAQAVCGSSGRRDHALIDRLLEAHGAEEFPFRFLEAKGFDDAAKKIRQALARRSLDAPLQPVVDTLAC